MNVHADKLHQSFSDDDINHLRFKAKTDKFFLGYGILGYNKFSKNLHGELSQWLKNTDVNQYRLILLPRSHYKSTLCTITDSIQLALPDDLGNQPHPRNLGPNVRVLIAHETHESAARFLFSITNHFTSNPTLLALFPELSPDPRHQKINKNELELPRSQIWNEPTFDTTGVGGKSQGKHFNFIKGDDLYGASARDSKTERETTINWVDNLQSLLITPKNDHIDFIGTRWAFDDVYAHIIKVYAGRLFKYVRACEELTPVLEDGKIVKRRLPIFPEEFRTQDLEILKKNRMVWNAQYANNPAESSASFNPDHLRYYYYSGVNEITVKGYGLDDRKIDVRKLDKLILIDPATKGDTGFIVTGTDSRNRIYVLEAIKKAWNPPDLVDVIFQKVIRWQPRLVGIEEVLFSSLFQFWLAREQQTRGIRFKIEPLKTRQKFKDERIMGLSSYYQAGQIYHNEGQAELNEEYHQFGASHEIHLLDALAYGPALWRASINEGQLDKWKTTEMKFMEQRDSLTGY